MTQALFWPGLYRFWKPGFKNNPTRNQTTAPGNSESVNFLWPLSLGFTLKGQKIPTTTTLLLSPPQSRERRMGWRGGGAEAGTRTAACLSAIYIFAKPPSSYFFKEIKGDFHLSLSLSLSLSHFRFLFAKKTFSHFFLLLLVKEYSPREKATQHFEHFVIWLKR